MAANYKFTLNLTPDQLANLCKPEFESVVDAVADEFKTTIQSPVFHWDSTTHRKNGAIVPPGQRDAVDTGELLRGQQDPVYLDNRTARIEWSQIYTPLIFNHASVDLVDFTLSRIKL